MSWFQARFFMMINFDSNDQSPQHRPIFVLKEAAVVNLETKCEVHVKLLWEFYPCQV